jgi:hypothetical protein
MIPVPAPVNDEILPVSDPAFNGIYIIQLPVGSVAQRAFMQDLQNALGRQLALAALQPIPGREGHAVGLAAEQLIRKHRGLPANADLAPTLVGWGAVSAYLSHPLSESEPNRGRQNHAAWRECDEFAHGLSANSASPFAENSPLRTATRPFAGHSPPTVWFTLDHIQAYSPLESRAWPQAHTSLTEWVHMC